MIQPSTPSSSAVCLSMSLSQSQSSALRNTYMAQNLSIYRSPSPRSFLNITAGRIISDYITTDVGKAERSRYYLHVLDYARTRQCCRLHWGLDRLTIDVWTNRLCRAKLASCKKKKASIKAYPSLGRNCYREKILFKRKSKRHSVEGVEQTLQILM